MIAGAWRERSRWLRVSANAFGAAALVMIAALPSCADFDSGIDPAFGLPDVVVGDPSFSGDIQPILDQRCSIGGCHSLATAQAGLTLATGASYASLVGVASTLRPQYLRVAPGDAENSWLIRMISDDPAARFGHQRMPLSSLPLTPNQIATITNWIEQGAPNN